MKLAIEFVSLLVLAVLIMKLISYHHISCILDFLLLIPLCNLLLHLSSQLLNLLFNLWCLLLHNLRHRLYQWYLKSSLYLLFSRKK